MNHRGIESKITDCEDKKKSPTNVLWNFSIWNKLNQAMVRQCDLTWNPLYDSILTIYKKLRDLGFEYRDGEIIIRDGNNNEY